MIKAAFFDVDGTLFSHTMHMVPESARKAVHLLRENGIKVFLATGRGIKIIKRVSWGDLEFDGYVTLNGQVCLDSEENILFEAPIKGEDAAYLIDAFQTRKMPLVIIEKDRTYINFINERVRQAQKAVSIPLLPTAEYKGAPIYQMIGYLNRQEAEVLAEKIPNCKITRWYEEGIDIISKDGGKANGIQKILDVYGIKREEIIAFGDGDNDLDMLEFAGIGVAMGNAVKCVKEAADYVTSHIDEDGIWNACRHFNLFE
jgi:Cof subfamily protein (haloacid dehalogenase superfamily)